MPKYANIYNLWKETHDGDLLASSKFFFGTPKLLIRLCDFGPNPQSAKMPKTTAPTTTNNCRSRTKGPLSRHAFPDKT
jgi:hypothetical protein